MVTSEDEEIEDEERGSVTDEDEKIEDEERGSGNR